MNQLSIAFDAPKHNGSSTSRAAAAKTNAPRDRERVLAYIQWCGQYGATNEQVAIALGIGTNTVNGRASELTKANLIKDSGLRRPTSTGAMAAVRVAT